MHVFFSLTIHKLTRESFRMSDFPKGSGKLFPALYSKAKSYWKCVTVFIIKQIGKILAWELTKCFLIAIASRGILGSFVIKGYRWYLLVNWLVFCLDHNLWKNWLDTLCYIIKLFGCKNCLNVWAGFSVCVLLTCSVWNQRKLSIH